MVETWYVLEDGSVADPNACAPDNAGILRYKTGQAVALRGNAYSSRSVNPDDHRDKPAEPERQKRAYNRRDLKAE